MGRQEQVEKAAANLRESIKELENTAEDEIQIDGEYFKKVTSRSVSYLFTYWTSDSLTKYISLCSRKKRDYISKVELIFLFCSYEF